MKGSLFFISLLMSFSYSVTAIAQQVNTLKRTELFDIVIKRYEEAWNLRDPIGLALTPDG